MLDATPIAETQPQEHNPVGNTGRSRKHPAHHLPDQLLMALAGQPNAGKSTVFNLLTGARQDVANYTGVIVEKKVGHLTLQGREVELAHTPWFSCLANGDNTITCAGGFSDGSSAAGSAVLILDTEGNTTSQLAIEAHTEVTFPKPEGAYAIRFDAGKGHAIDVADKDILQ